MGKYFFGILFWSFFGMAQEQICDPYRSAENPSNLCQIKFCSEVTQREFFVIYNATEGAELIPTTIIFSFEDDLNMKNDIYSLSVHPDASEKYRPTKFTIGNITCGDLHKI